MLKLTVIEKNPEMLGLVEMITDIEYARPDGEALKMHLVKPMWSSGGKGFPLVVFIQGSGFTKPDQVRQLPQMSLLARRGFVIASVTHRSRCTAPSPAFLQDVKASLRFLRAHAGTYDIDKERVCAWGTSSGGNTALLMGLTAEDPAFETSDWAGESTRVQAVVDCFGPTDLNRMIDVQCVDPEDGLRQLIISLSGRDTAEEIREQLNLISPIRYVEAGKELPPFLLLHGDADPLVLHSDTMTLAEKLDQCGYDVEMVTVPDGPHEGSFWSPALLEKIFDFIQEKLA